MDLFLSVLIFILGALAALMHYLRWCTSRVILARSERYLSQTEAMAAFSLVLIEELYQADMLIGTEWPGTDEEVYPNLEERLRKLSAIVDVDFEAVKQELDRARFNEPDTKEVARWIQQGGE